MGLNSEWVEIKRLYNSGFPFESVFVQVQNCYGRQLTTAIMVFEATFGFDPYEVCNKMGEGSFETKLVSNDYIANRLNYTITDGFKSAEIFLSDYTIKETISGQIFKANKELMFGIRHKG